ncbi:MAG: hypothetical protein VZR06_00485 [Butyrivibrio sp.]|nr:hypothetical protein [Butyrivibrio sp.]
MFKKRYEPHIRGDKVTIIDKRTAVMYPLMYGIVTMYVLIIWGIGSFSDDMKLNVIILAGVYLGVTAMCICFERKYVIEPESISVFYGIFGKKINLHNVTHCFRNSYRHISLADDREREVTIDLAHLPDGAEKYFLESLRNTNVNIRNIGYFVEHEGGTNYNYKFKMCQREAKVGKIAILLICLLFEFIFVAIWATSPEVRSMFTKIIVGTALLWIVAHSGFTNTVCIDGEFIEFRRWFKKTKRISVKDIVWVYVANAIPNNTANKFTEVMNIRLKDAYLKSSIQIGRGLTNYDMFVAYLLDNGVPFSLDGKKVIDTKEAEKQMEPDISEILNLKDYAFTVNDDYVIENGIFAGKKFDEKQAPNADYTAYQSRNKIADTTGLIIYCICFFAICITLLQAQTEKIGYVTALLIMFGIGLFGDLVQLIKVKRNYKDVTEGASCYPATLFSTVKIGNRQFISYAYADGDTVRIIESLFLGKKTKNYKELYNVPTFIWANPDKAPRCVEGTEERPLGNSAITKRIVTGVITGIGLIVMGILLSRI